MTVRGRAELEDFDRELLNAVQWDFPLEPRPFAALSERLGLDEPAVRARVARVKELGVLRREPGALVPRRLPTLTLYKIGVKLDMTGKTAADAKAAVLEHERPERREHMEAPTLSDLEVAAIRVVQDDLPLVERPFAAEG